MQKGTPSAGSLDNSGFCHWHDHNLCLEGRRPTAADSGELPFAKLEGKSSASRISISGPLPPVRHR